MARASSDTSSWPMTITTAAHPHHKLAHLRFLRNSCNVCGGALAGKLGYRCEPCDFDVHCDCLPEHRTMARVGPVHAPPRPHAHHPPPSRPNPPYGAAPPPSPYNHQPSYTSGHHAPPPLRPQLNLSLSGSSNFDGPHHQQQQGGQTAPSPQQPQTQQSYLATQPQQSYGYGYYGRRAEPDAPVSYSHLQQQQDYYPITNNYGDYVDNYSAATEFGNAYADDYYDSRDNGDGDDY